MWAGGGSYAVRSEDTPSSANRFPFLIKFWHSPPAPSYQRGVNTSSFGSKTKPISSSSFKPHQSDPILAFSCKSCRHTLGSTHPMFQSTSTLRALQSASKCSFFISTKLGLLAPGGFSATATRGISSSSDTNVFLRSYQVVVSATLDMGIGKDGKLPWKLPSDLNFFKELTVTTSDPAKRNAVVMGSRTWDSIPLKFRPLPGRLNVVLTRSQRRDFDGENVVVCSNIPSALQLLAESPYCLSTEKVFVIGGGQVLREALNAPGCDAIHITEIETRIECDTFIPTIDLSSFRLWYSSPPMVENNIRFSFATYVRLRNSENGKLNDDLSSNMIEVKNYRFLPKMIFEKRDEYGYLRPVEEIISSGVEKNDI